MSRSRYVYKKNEDTGEVECFLVSSDYTGAERKAQTSTEELTYGGARTTDGVDISSRKKHRDYLRRTGFTVASDFTETWAKAQVERDKLKTGTNYDGGKLRDTIGRAMHDVETRKRRR